MGKSSLLMMTSTFGKLNPVSDVMRADGWYGYTDGLHTIAVVIVDFQGKLIFEGSIADNPQEGDWFAIKDSTFSFPKDPLNPTGALGDTNTFGFNIVGNYTWLRCRVDRSYLSPQPDTQLAIEALGYVDRILMNN